MERADRGRFGRPGRASAGTVDAEDGATPEPDGAAGPPRPRAAAEAGRGTGAGAVAGHGPGMGDSGGPGAGAGLSPRIRHAALILGYLAAGVALTWPRAAYLTGRLPEDRDTASYVWGFNWVAEQVIHLGNPWFTDQLAAPVGVNLGFHTLMPLPGLLMMPVTLLFGPSAAYNLLVAAVPGLLCYTCYRAARLWLPSETGAVAAGAFFGLSAMLTQQDWYHLNIAAGALFLPMALEASARLRRRPGWRQGLTLGLVMGAAVLTDQESAVLAAIVTALVLLPWLVRRPGWPKVRLAATAAGVGAAVAAPQIIAMAQEVAVGGLAIPADTLAVSYKQYGVGVPGMFSPTPRVADFGLGALAGPFLHGRDNEGMPMFGTVLTLLALAGLVIAWRRLGAWRLGALWLGCAALALGASLWVGKSQYVPLGSTWHGVSVSDLMPYTWFVRIPGLSSFREADRLAILGLLPAALLAGAAVDWLRWHARWALVIVAALGLLEAGYSGDPHIGQMPTSYAGVDRPIKADHSHSIVLDIPFGLRGGIPVYGVPFFPQALVMATEDGHPRAIAYDARVPTNTINALSAHSFYSDLVAVQHEVKPSCPWELTNCPPVGGLGVLVSHYLKFTAAQLAADGAEATRMRIGWAVVWKRNPSNQAYVLAYLRDTGFQYVRNHDIGHDYVLVYRHATH